MPLRAEDGRNGVTAGGGLNQEHEPTARNDDGGVGSLVAALANRLGDSGRSEAYSGFSSTSISPTVQRPSLLLEKRARRRGVRISRMSSRRLLSSASSHASLSNRISARISSAVRSGSIGARGFSVRPASSRSK